MDKNVDIVILAAGFGSRLSPLTQKSPKGLLEIDKGIQIVPSLLEFLKDYPNKTIVSGYRSSDWKQTIEKYNLKSVFNNEFSSTNSLYSLYLAIKNKPNAKSGLLILTSDVFFKHNIFDKNFDYSWVNTVDSDENKPEWEVVKKNDFVEKFIIRKRNKEYKNNKFEYITGATFIHSRDYKIFRESVINRLKNSLHKENDYWENALVDVLTKIKLKTFNCTNEIYEIDDFDDLTKFNSNPPCLVSDIHLNRIQGVFGVDFSKIKILNL